MIRLSARILISYFLACCSFCSLANASLFDRDAFTNYFDIMPPHSVSGMTINFRIENVSSTLTSGYATQGVIVKQYKKDGTWTAIGVGGSDQRVNNGSYKYQRTGHNTAVEKATDPAGVRYTTQYTFITTNSGTWVQNFNNGQIVSSGSFTLVSTHTENQTAPDSIAKLNIALFIEDAVSDLPPDTYPQKGLAVQTYAEDGTLAITGFGPKTLNSKCTYSYKKVSPNTAVEETIQVTQLFTLPYTTVFTFETPTSGTWFQNLGNGFIKFRGSFHTSPN